MQESLSLPSPSLLCVCKGGCFFIPLLIFFSFKFYQMWEGNQIIQQHSTNFYFQIIPFTTIRSWLFLCRCMWPQVRCIDVVDRTSFHAFCLCGLMFNMMNIHSAGLTKGAGDNWGCLRDFLVVFCSVVAEFHLAMAMKI